MVVDTNQDHGRPLQKLRWERVGIYIYFPLSLQWLVPAYVKETSQTQGGPVPSSGQLSLLSHSPVPAPKGQANCLQQLCLTFETQILQNILYHAATGQRKRCQVHFGMNRPWSQTKALSSTLCILHFIEQAQEICRNEVLMLVTMQYWLFPQRWKEEKKNHVKYQATWLYKANMRVKKNSKYSSDIISTAWHVRKKPSNKLPK